MPESIKRWACRPTVQFWLMYLGLVTLGALVMAPATLYIVHVERQRNAEEVQRLHEINRDLVEVIMQRLPETLEAAKSAASEAGRAADSARDASEKLTDVVPEVPQLRQQEKRK